MMLKDHLQQRINELRQQEVEAAARATALSGAAMALEELLPRIDGLLEADKERAPDLEPLAADAPGPADD